MRAASLLFGVLALASTSFCQSSPPAQPSIQGHLIGESVAEYFAKGPGPDLLGICRALLVSPQPAPPKKRRGDGLVYGIPPGDVPGTPEQKYKVALQQRDSCASLASAADNGDRFDSANVTFDRGVLVRMAVDVGLTERMNSQRGAPRYEAVVLDVAKKFGFPGETGDLPTQNGFGALFHHRYSEWASVGLYVRVDEVDASLDFPYTSITVESSEERRRELAKVGERKSVLD